MPIVRCGFIVCAPTSQKPGMKLNFSDSFFDIQLNLENENIFEPLTNQKKTKQPSSDTAKTIASGLKFVSININSI